MLKLSWTQYTSYTSNLALGISSYLTFLLSTRRLRVWGPTSYLSLTHSIAFVPAVDSGSSDNIEERVKAWNELLKTQATDFGANSKATVVVFSVHQVLKEILEDPTEYDFDEDDPLTEGGGIWEDDLHLTAEVHEIIAERLLESVSP